jgi:mannose-6-phosphate isomerase-like protein (cupin superfamily)
MQVDKVWGYYIVLNEKDNYKIKKLVINPYQKISYQLHNNRDEYWILLNGNCDIIVNGNKKIMNTYITEHIPAKVKHQIINNNAYAIEILELQTGICDEDDIIRF